MRADIVRPQRRRKASDWDTTARSVDTYAGFKVGQEVTVVRNTKTIHDFFTGTITRLIVPLTGWKFAVVEDGCGGSYAVDFEELS